jgi:hypothetical protein
MARSVGLTGDAGLAVGAQLPDRSHAAVRSVQYRRNAVQGRTGGHATFARKGALCERAKAITSDRVTNLQRLMFFRYWTTFFDSTISPGFATFAASQRSFLK